MAKVETLTEEKIAEETHKPDEELGDKDIPELERLKRLELELSNFKELKELKMNKNDKDEADKKDIEMLDHQIKEWEKNIEELSKTREGPDAEEFKEAA